MNERKSSLFAELKRRNVYKVAAVANEITNNLTRTPARREIDLFLISWLPDSCFEKH